LLLNCTFARRLKPFFGRRAFCLGLAPWKKGPRPEKLMLDKQGRGGYNNPNNQTA